MKFKVIIFSCLLFIGGCSHRNLQVQGKAVNASETNIFALHITKNETAVTWVCYTEIEQHILEAVSCQNDTALPLFSAGRNKANKRQEFEFSLISKRLLLVSPKNTLGYLQIALYPSYQVNSKQLEINKNTHKTIIKDPANQIEVEIVRL